MKLFFISIFVLLTSFIFSQNEYEDDEFKTLSTKSFKKAGIHKAYFKLSLLFPAVGGEVGLAEKFSLDFGARLGINAGVNGIGQTYFFPQPSLVLEPKWNYNIKRRLQKGKNISKYSSNFLSLHSNFNIKVSPSTANYFVVGPAWGLQRNFSDIAYVKFKTGLAYRYVFNAPIKYSHLVILLNLQLGFVF